MEQYQQDIFSHARDVLKVGSNAKEVYFWEETKFTLIPVEIEKLDDHGKEQWRSALSNITRFPREAIDDNMLMQAHKYICGDEEKCAVENDAMTNAVKKHRGTSTLYFQEEGGVETGMSYYSKQSVSKDTKCYELTHDSNGNVNVTRIHTYAFLIDNCESHAFIYKGRLKTLLYFQPDRPSTAAIAKTSIATCENVKYNDPEVGDILFAMKAKYNASFYFDNMHRILHKMMNEK